jgi:hypothetical protein
LRRLRLHDPGPPRLWKIGYALITCSVAALAGLAVLWRAALALLSHPEVPHPKVISLHDTVGVWRNWYSPRSPAPVRSSLW